ncbi:Pentatricopeptide repeat-containing protein [Nymphaea thermarum]|nr:Pentatricopeptide repeat-containing protein [Nymphaea thermarum]
MHSLQQIYALFSPIAYVLCYPQINRAESGGFPSYGRRKGAPLAYAVQKNIKEKSSKKEHHLWKRRETAGSGQKALNLVSIVTKLSNEKETVYGALDKWVAWETEFPLVTKWMLSKGLVLTMGTYDTLLLAFDMDGRIDEAETVWRMILETHTRSVPRRLFSRMTSLYDHHHMPEKLLEVFADMEELGVKPDEDTVRRIARAFHKLGQEDKRKQVIQRYGLKWKYIHFNGERVKIKIAEDG